MAGPQQETASSVDESSRYPEPLVIRPKREHKQTIIILHGRGDTASNFAALFLLRDIPKYTLLQSAFPDAKFVFPGASKRPTEVLKGARTSQWFDYWPLKRSEKNEDLQIDGLRETTEHIHSLLKAEIAIVGAANVVLWGLSQGCASSLIASILWDGEPFAAVVGMCGWLPFQKHLRMIVLGPDAQDEDGSMVPSRINSPEPSGQMNIGRPLSLEAAQWLRQKLGCESSKQHAFVLESIPVCMRHGKEDTNVFTPLGRQATDCLRVLGVQVDYDEYEGLGHWYSGPMIHDIILFLRDTVGWNISVP